MTNQQILEMIIAKIEATKDRIEQDYSKGSISNDVRSNSLFYNDLLKYDLQKLIKSINN